eukprot:evm.model.scf_1866.3 EVM.evm.TU.scf_1866.3   scf_1866:22062-23210(+)
MRAGTIGKTQSSLPLGDDGEVGSYRTHSLDVHGGRKGCARLPNAAAILAARRVRSSWIPGNNADPGYGTSMGDAMVDHPPRPGMPPGRHDFKVNNSQVWWTMGLKVVISRGECEDAPNVSEAHDKYRDLPIAMHRSVYPKGRGGALESQFKLKGAKHHAGERQQFSTEYGSSMKKHPPPKRTNVGIKNAAADRGNKVILEHL